MAGSASTAGKVDGNMTNVIMTSEKLTLNNTQTLRGVVASQTDTFFLDMDHLAVAAAQRAGQLYTESVKGGKGLGPPRLHNIAASFEALKDTCTAEATPLFEEACEQVKTWGQADLDSPCPYFKLKEIRGERGQKKDEDMDSDDDEKTKTKKTGIMQIELDLKCMKQIGLASSDKGPMAIAELWYHLDQTLKLAAAAAANTGTSSKKGKAVGPAPAGPLEGKVGKDLSTLQKN